ncbi:MAG: hypothetical protein WCF65_06990 [Parachlamydiaceae bacterium]
MKKISIKVIYDNCKANNGFQESWGFSCLIDLGPRKILFDTGADPKAFFSNLQKLNLLCKDITDVVFSHKHSDHTAEFEEIVGKLTEGSRLFLPQKFPSKKIPSYIQTKIVEDFTEIHSGVYSLALKGGFRLYEQSLILQIQKGLVIITGCAHPEIINLLETAQKRLKQPIHLVLGGFHLFRSKQSDIDQIIKRFKDLQVEIAAPCHCSGDIAIEKFRQAFKDNFYQIGTGTILTLDQKNE